MTPIEALQAELGEEVWESLSPETRALAEKCARDWARLAVAMVAGNGLGRELDILRATVAQLRVVGGARTDQLYWVAMHTWVESLLRIFLRVAIDSLTR